MIRDFYGKYAHYYDIISNDRNFSEQIVLLKKTIQSNNKNIYNFLELFAGPARHSIAASTHEDINIFAVDNSQEMQDLAMEIGFPDRSKYWVSDFPLDKKFDNINAIKFDCVLCLRYSIGYLNRKSILELLMSLKNRLKSDGKIIMELHNISNMMMSMKGTDIHKRIATSKYDETVECLWPDGEIVWSNIDYLAKMNVSVNIKKNNKEKTLKFLSEENIYMV
ncbi:MAG: class I SAM-dependent methyltransferase [Polaribacter sp.]